MKNGWAAGRRAYRWSQRSLLAAGIVFLGLVIFPDPLFANQLTHGRFVVYSSDPIPSNIYAILDDAQEKLDTAEIKLTKSPVNVFLCSKAQYRLLGLGKKSFGHSYPLMPRLNVYVNQTDVQANTVSNGTGLTRKLTNLLAHEVSHHALNQQIGLWRQLGNRWKVEGYCDYVAGGSTLTPSQGYTRRAQASKKGADVYFRSYWMVRYLLDKKRVGARALFEEPFDESEVEKRAFSEPFW